MDQIRPLRVGLSDNYHAEGGSRNYTLPKTYFIKIRKDKPFVFDFSNKPAVIFASLPKDKTYKPGDEIEVKAVLIDPVCNIMIRDLDDTGRRQGNSADGKKQKLPIARPVGDDHRLGRQEDRRGPDALWLRRHLRVLVASTKELKLAGKSETFTVTVAYDTLDLYGKVEASRKIVLTSP